MPDYENAYYNRGLVYAQNQKGEHALAIKDFSEAIRLMPDYENAYIARGIAYKEKGEQAKADTDFAKADADFAKAKELKAKK